MNIGRLKARIAEQNNALAQRYWARAPIARIIGQRVAFFDALLQELWRGHFSVSAQAQMLLYAVGGYGRGELHPGSDIDLLILAIKPDRCREEIAPFVRLLYDLNIDVGYSVRSLKDCRTEIKGDITVATAILERRLLTQAGTPALQRLAGRLDRLMAHPRIWPAARYLAAKRAEQEGRHRRFQDVEYGLEPNVKESPGGLRDLQTALWVCKRKYGSGDPEELKGMGLITAQERDWLIEGRRYLCWVRYGLHLVAGRKDDRLQFEHQRTLAQRLGYVDTEARQGVERFMQEYYRWVLALREVNDIVLQSLEESFRPARGRVTPINERFQLNDQSIEAVHERVFAEDPGALLEMFVLLANRTDISEVRAGAIRLIRQHVHLIDDAFRNDSVNAKRFLELLRAPHSLVTQLTRMRRYGILGRYIPEFGQVIGRMQHDLFHIYTVDAHTMMVLRNLRLFRYPSRAKEFPLAHRCVQTVPKIELLYLAGLYHDVGKGRGGDHSRLGADFAVAFCRRLGLDEDDVELVRWLVAEHLVMSDTAQRKDIHDPEVVLEFAKQVQSEVRLKYLYALTVADITATNPSLWNSWRATLLRQLYVSAQALLRNGLEAPMDRQEVVRARRAAASAQAQALGLDGGEAGRLWRRMGDDFMLRHQPKDAAEIALAVARHDLAAGPLVLVRSHTSEGPVAGMGEAATEIFIWAADRPNLFAACVTTLSQLRLSIFDAQIHTAQDGACCNSFIVLDADRRPIQDGAARVIHRLTQALQAPSVSPPRRLRWPRQHKQLHQPSEVSLSHANDAPHSTLRVRTTDRPGLLAHIGILFQELDIAVLEARIATLGERVEDVFEVQTRAGEPIRDPATIYELENTLRQTLDNL